MYLHSGAVPVGPCSAGDVGQHSGDDRGEFQITTIRLYMNETGVETER